MAEELADSRDAERAFLLSVSHELKTPLTAIRGYAEGLADGAFDADEAARVDRRSRPGGSSGSSATCSTSARMNRSEFSIRTGPVDVAAVAREAVQRHEAAARGFERRA